MIKSTTSRLSSFRGCGRPPWLNSRISGARAGHLRWPALDVDLTLDSIVNPEAYPLVSRGMLES